MEFGYILGLMILLINIGARYIGNEVGDFMHKVLNHKFSIRFLIFLVLWMGTRDLVVAGVITISFIVIVTTIFNEHSDYDCIVHFHCPIKTGSPVPVASQREYECGSHECGKNTSNNLEIIE